MKNKTLCSAFWKHTNIRSGNRIFPCCRYKTSVQTFDGDVNSIINSQEYKELRANSLAGIPNSNCQKCYEEEEKGNKSLRNWFNENYYINTIKLEYLEIGFDNICNLACDGCWEEWSSSWWKKKNPDDSVKNGILDTREFYNIPQNLEKVVFLGGEPLMTNRHRKFLLDIDDLSNLDVTYYTNGMFELVQKDIDLLDKCKAVTFMVSIDAVGELNNKVREGSNWERIEHFVYNCPYNIIINSVIHKNNWHGFFDLANWISKNNLDWKINVLTYPKSLSIQNLHNYTKKDIINTLKNLNLPNKEYILSFLNEA